MACGNSLFGGNNNYIKVGNGQLIAVEGANTAEKLILSDLRIPYTQLLKGRVILKAGQEDYLMNHLGLGDNVTFITIKATYNEKSLETDNYIIWKRYDDLFHPSQMGKLMILTGNSTNRIPQLYLTNPNPNYDVKLDIMVAIIDDVESFFNYDPVVYFTEYVTLENTEYNEPFNTTLGDSFGATISYGAQPIYKDELTYLFIDEVRDLNGITISTTSSNFILKDYFGYVTPSVTGVGTYSLTFDITDDYGNSVPDNKSLYIIVSIGNTGGTGGTGS